MAANRTRPKGLGAAINRRPVRIEFWHAPRPARTGLTFDDVEDVIRGLEGEPDILAEIYWDDNNTNRRPFEQECVSVFVSGANVFLCMDRPLDGMFQYVSRGSADREGYQQFMIHNEETPIESRYIVDIETAALVVQEWLRNGEDSTLGWWERQ